MTPAPLLFLVVFSAAVLSIRRKNCRRTVDTASRAIAIQSGLRESAVRIVSDLKPFWLVSLSPSSAVPFGTTHTTGGDFFVLPRCISLRRSTSDGVQGYGREASAVTALVTDCARKSLATAADASLVPDTRAGKRN